jgi:DNA primase
MIGEAKIAEIRARASIVEVVSDYLTLKKAGRNHVGLCPFHADKNPSFTVNEEKGIFHCFACGVGGNVFNFLMQFEHLSFPEAVERVAKRYGIVVERTDGRQDKKETEDRESLFRINERAALYYREVLFRHPEGRRALDYLKRRGIEEAVADRYYLGYAPQSGRGLVEQLRKERLSLQEAARIGLVGERKPEFITDKFFGRLMFPILDASGRIVGFGGRVLGDGLPKYLNSAETPLFHKGSTLYGLFQAKEAVRREDCVIVVEGYLDVLALCQYGFPSVVATLGTALTADHVRILSRYSKSITALFDGDDAGRKAAARSFEIFVEGGVLGKGAFLPSGEDPDSFVRAHGKEALEAILNRAVPMADYYLGWLERQYGKTLEGRSRTAQEVSRVLVKIRNPFEADLLARRASDTLGIREELLRSPPPGMEVRSRLAAPTPSQSTIKEGLPADFAERSVLGLMLRFPTLADKVIQRQELTSLISGKWKNVILCVRSLWQTENKIEVASLMQQISPEEAAEVSGILLEAETVEEAESEKMIEDCIAHLHRRHLKELQKEVRRAIRIAEENKDEKVRKERILEWQEITRRKDRIARREI